MLLRWITLAWLYCVVGCTSVAAASVKIGKRVYARQQNVANAPSAEQTLDVLMLAVKPTCVTKRVVESVNLYLQPTVRHVHIVTANASHCGTFASFAPNVRCWDEEHAVHHLSYAAMKDAMLENFALNSTGHLRRKRFGWYYQQLLKLGAGYENGINLTDTFVIWDADMLLLQPYTVLQVAADGTHLTAVAGGGLVFEGYKLAHFNLFGRPLHTDDDSSSFVAHHMVVKRALMMEFLHELSSKAGAALARPGLPAWAAAVLSAVQPELVDVGFSEYWTYLSWLWDTHPETVYLAGITWWRHPSNKLPVTGSVLYENKKIDYCCPNATALQDLRRSHNLTFVGFELGHHPHCNYRHPAFNDGQCTEASMC